MLHLYIKFMHTTHGNSFDIIVKIFQKGNPPKMYRTITTWFKRSNTAGWYSRETVVCVMPMVPKPHRMTFE